MSARVRWDGLEELKADLRNLPRALADEGAGIVYAAADRAAGAIVAGYPRRTGDLGKGVSVKRENSSFGAAAIVRNRAPHAHLFELGTEVRHTAIGANRGRMPPGHVFIPIVQRERRAMYERLKELLRRQGLTVTGDA